MDKDKPGILGPSFFLCLSQPISNQHRVPEEEAIRKVLCSEHVPLCTLYWFRSVLYVHVLRTLAELV